MKRIHIIGILVIAVAVGVILTLGSDASTYTTFEGAKNLAAEQVTSEVHVVGELPKNEDGRIQGMEYNPDMNPNLFSFLLQDSLGYTARVKYRKPKPQDFERSEKIVIIGKFEGEVFEASQILMKCPSKYVETEVK